VTTAPLVAAAAAAPTTLSATSTLRSNATTLGTVSSASTLARPTVRVGVAAGAAGGTATAAITLSRTSTYGSRYSTGTGGPRSASSTLGGGKAPSLKFPDEAPPTLKRTLPPPSRVRADAAGAAAVYPELLLLAERDDVGGVETALRRQPSSATMRSVQGWTALHAAAKASASAVIGLLLGAGLDLEEADEDGNTPLFVAARFNGANTMAQLVARNAQANRRNRDGRTMLQEAIYRESDRAFQWVLERSGPSEARQPGGESLNAAGPEWWRTSLILAIAELVDVDTYVMPLLAAGADPRQTTASGQTALHYAVLRDHAPAAAALLRAHPLLVNEPLAATWTRTALNLAIVERKTVALVRTLLDAGADASVEDSEGHTALEVAIVHGEDSGRLLQTLLAHPSSEPLMHRVSTGWWRTPLHLAARLDKPEHVRLLAEAGGADLDVNAEDERGRTPLVLALVENCPKALAVLLRLPGVDVNRVSSKAWRGPVHAAIAFNSLALLPTLLASADVDLTLRDSVERTVAEFAVAANSLEALRLLVPAHISPRAETPPTRRTLLHVAVQFNRPGMVRLLLQLGANPNARNAQGLTPRVMADQMSQRECADEFKMHERLKVGA
jgi:ankyrin repeat protein